MSKENLPSIQYTTFIDAYQAAVALKQREIAEMEASQREYLACADALAATPIRSDGRLKLTTCGAEILIRATSTDRLSSFEDLVAGVGRALCDRKLRDDAVPAVNRRSAFSPRIQYTFATRRNDVECGRVDIMIEVPLTGLADCIVVEHQETSAWPYYNVIPGAGATEINHG